MHRLLRTLPLLASLQLAAPALAQSWCSPGARLNVSYSVLWYAATAISSQGGKCLVHYDKFSASSDERVGPDRAAPLGQTVSFAAAAQGSAPRQNAATPGAGAVAAGAIKPGHYHCTFFANRTLTTVPGFTVKGSTYVHDNGGSGTLNHSIDKNLAEFVGGPLAGQAGKVEPGVIRLFNERRSRTVIDCEA